MNGVCIMHVVSNDLLSNLFAVFALAVRLLCIKFVSPFHTAHNHSDIIFLVTHVCS